MNEGWLCPRCGKVWGPITFECLDCNTKVDEISGERKLKAVDTIRDEITKRDEQ